ncbi:MAG TPA: hypothetical protein VGM41_01085 [Chitinophagaceae bacterium]|jgi:hypothetical protein
MKYIKTIRLIIGFYRSFFPATFLITLCCVFLFREYGPHILVPLLWLKAATLGLVFYFINSYKKKEFYYYRNLGISNVILWSTTLGFDIVLYIFLLTKIPGLI